jgi:hypothetical protein
MNGTTVDAHVTRMKFYSDSSLNISEELLSYIASNAATGYIVNKIIACRNIDGEWQFLVDWSGFTELDQTWEPATHLIEDVPDIVNLFISCHTSDPNVRDLAHQFSLF